jgi:hypothetical protein
MRHSVLNTFCFIKVYLFWHTVRDVTWTCAAVSLLPQLQSFACHFWVTIQKWLVQITELANPARADVPCVTCSLPSPSVLSNTHRQAMLPEATTCSVAHVVTLHLLDPGAGLLQFRQAMTKQSPQVSPNNLFWTLFMISSCRLLSSSYINSDSYHNSFTDQLPCHSKHTQHSHGVCPSVRTSVQTIAVVPIPKHICKWCEFNRNILLQAHK